MVRLEFVYMREDHLWLMTKDFGISIDWNPDLNKLCLLRFDENGDELYVLKINSYEELLEALKDYDHNLEDFKDDIIRVIEENTVNMI